MFALASLASVWTTLRAKFSTSFTDNAKLFGNFLVHSSGCPNWAFSTTNTVRWHSRCCSTKAHGTDRRKSRDNNDVDAATSFGAILKCLDRVQVALASYSVCACPCACVSACACACECSHVCVSYFARFCVACFSVYLGHCLSLLPSQGFRQTKAEPEVEATAAAETSPEGQKKQPKGFQLARDLLSLWLWLPY